MMGPNARPALKRERGRIATSVETAKFLDTSSIAGAYVEAARVLCSVSNVLQACPMGDSYPTRAFGRPLNGTNEKSRT
jgi:hypothetical protein